MQLQRSAANEFKANLVPQQPSRKHQLHPSILHGAETKPVFHPVTIQSQQLRHAHVDANEKSADCTKMRS